MSMKLENPSSGDGRSLTGRIETILYLGGVPLDDLGLGTPVLMVVERNALGIPTATWRLVI